MEILWKKGSQHKVEAAVAYEVIEALRAKNNGDVTAEDVVNAAKVKRNPLHAEFEWDDSVAGREWRLHHARKLMQSFVVVRNEIATDRPQRVYEVIRLPQEKPKTRPKHVYRTVEDIIADPDMRAEMLGRALSELISIRNRYRDLQELAVVLRAIDELVETIPQ